MDIDALPARFRKRVVINEETGCWEWGGFIRSDGYGRYGSTVHTKTYVHRFAYEALVGPIPAGLVIDHLCRVKHCCNPEHLEAVTQRTNVLRGTGHFAKRAAQTHCIYGHEFTEDNTNLTKKGTRECRKCQARRSLKNNRRRRALGLR